MSPNDEIHCQRVSSSYWDKVQHLSDGSCTHQSPNWIAGVSLFAVTRRLRAAGRARRWNAKLKADAKEPVLLIFRMFLLVLLQSCVKGVRTPHPRGYVRADHPDGPSRSWWYNMKVSQHEAAFVRFRIMRTRDCHDGDVNPN